MIATEAGKPLFVDDFTNCLRKIGYARVKIELNVAEPLKLGVLIRGKKGAFWQAFVYENLPMVCYRCGCIGHSDQGCSVLEAELPPAGDCALRPQNFVAQEGEGAATYPAPLVPEGKD